MESQVKQVSEISQFIEKEANWKSKTYIRFKERVKVRIRE